MVRRDWAMREYCVAWASDLAKWSRARMDLRVYFSRMRPKLPRRPTPRTREEAKSQDLSVLAASGFLCLVTRASLCHC